MALFPELLELTTLEELVAALYGPAPDGDDYAAAYYDEVAILLREHGQRGIDALFEATRDTNAARVSAALLGLTTPPQDSPQLRELLLSLLDDDRDSVVAEAIDGLCHQGEAGAIDRVLALRDHPSPYVRGSVLRYVSGLYPDAARPMLIEALHAPHFIVRENAVDELDEMEDPSVVDLLPLIWPLLADPHPHVRQAAQTFIEHWQWWDQDDADVFARREDPSPYVRASVLRYMGFLDREAARAPLLAALEDPDPIVRMNAVDELYEIRDADKELPTLRRLLADPHPLVRQAAAHAVEGPDWHAPPEVEEMPVSVGAPARQ